VNSNVEGEVEVEHLGGFELDGIDLYLQRSLQRSPYRGKIKNPSTKEPDVPPQEQEENNN